MLKRLSLFLVLTAIVGYGIWQQQSNSTELPTPAVSTQSSQDQPSVLGRSQYQGAGIYISGGDGTYASGGLISLSSEEEAVVTLNGYQLSGTAKVTVYEANRDMVYSYLLRNKDSKQTSRPPDVASLRQIVAQDVPIETTSNSDTRITLPLSGSGTWYLTIEAQGKKADAFVVRSALGAVAKEGDNQFIFWAQDFRNKRSVPDITVQLYSFLENRRELGNAKTNSDGIATMPMTAEADVAVVERGGDFAIVPLNLRYLNYGYSFSSYAPKVKQSRYFLFTDRPLYQPGDKVYFKAIVRDDDDARYTIPTGNATVKITRDWNSEDVVYEKTVAFSADGTLSGEYEIPKDGKTGYYSLSVSPTGRDTNTGMWYGEGWSSNSVGFSVEYYRKSEFSIDIETDKRELIAGDALAFTIKGSYFSGESLIDRKVDYSVYTSDYFDYQFISDARLFGENVSSDFRYYVYGSKELVRNSVQLDTNGEAKVSLDSRSQDGSNKIYVIRANVSDGPDEAAYAVKNVLVYAGEYGIYRSDTRYTSRVSTQMDFPVELVPQLGSSPPGKVNLQASVKREWWVESKQENEKYSRWNRQEEALSNISGATGVDGKGKLSFTPEKTGSYTLTVEGEDRRGNVIRKNFYLYVTDKDQPITIGQGDPELTIVADKKKYEPTDNTVLTIVSNIPDRDVLLTFERGRVNRYMVVKLSGKQTDVRVPLEATDVPNIYAAVSSFSSYWLDSGSIDLTVSTEGKKLVVRLVPSETTTGPGESVGVTVETADVSGNPVSAEVAVWAVDKAIFELSDSKLGNIFETFWQKRYNNTSSSHSLEGILVNQAEGGGCFVSGTGVLMADGTEKRIEAIKVGEYVMTRSETDAELVTAKVLDIHAVQSDGYMILNSSLKVTPNHMLRVNETWKEAGSVQPGDLLTDQQGSSVVVTSVEWVRDSRQVHNLTVERYHTYFAGGVWVHNQKGLDRSVFKDTAYWNPSVRTDASGKAQLQVKLPDNLTTWVFAAVGTTRDTRVGQTTIEVVVSKDLVIRPVLPNILYEEDEPTLSATLQNFTSSEKTVDLSLTFDAGTVADGGVKKVTLAPKVSQLISWKAKAETAKEKATLVYKMTLSDDPKVGDVVTQTLPVLPYGFYESRGQSRVGTATYKVRLSNDARNQNSKVVVSLSPTIIGALPAAIEYLVGYPYGCTEQTTSRFVPSVIAKQYQSILGDIGKDKDLDGILAKGIARLATLQQQDGGWNWWYGKSSDPFVSAYVMEYLTLAKSAGVTVDEGIYQRAVNYFAQLSAATDDVFILKSYGMHFTGPTTPVPLEKLTNVTPDLIAMAAVVNLRASNTDLATNGIGLLLQKMKQQGDTVYWESGKREHFGSKDASTAFAIRALLLQGQVDTARNAVRYLTRNREHVYWTNTFATSQALRALVEYAQESGELSPTSGYTVSVDGREVASGSFNDIKQSREIDVAYERIADNGSEIVVTAKGSTPVYSALVIREFRTDRQLKAASDGLSVKREYVNLKGAKYGLGVGDSVLVRLTVSGLADEAYYGVIADELPAGMVPVNEQFLNQQYDADAVRNATNQYEISGREVTRNGMVLSLYRVGTGERVYTYRARVIAAGSFIAPPVVAGLMYAPEIHGRSATSQVVLLDTQQAPEDAPVIDEMTIVTPDVTVLDYVRAIGIGLFGLGVLIVMFVIAMRRFPRLKAFIDGFVGRIKGFSPLKRIRSKSPQDQPPNRKP